MKVILKPAPCGISFQIHKVERATQPLRECVVSKALCALMNDERPLEACSDPDLLVVKGFAYHPLMAATHLAFSEHRPLILSPDIVWITIAQGFAQHVLLHAEELRDHFVYHQGKLTLTVGRDDFAKGSGQNPWSEVFSEFGAQIRQHVGAEVYQTLVADFSTTGPVERAASEVVMMDAFQSYFDYVVLCICGIPELTLEGSPDDWKRLRDKAARLEQYGLEWWTRHLLPICDQFVRASQGDIDLTHWRNIYKLEHSYGVRVINGWMAKLLPYLTGGHAGPPFIKNPLLLQSPQPPAPAPVKGSWLGKLSQKLSRKPPPEPKEPEGISSSSFPPGLSKVLLLFVRRTPSEERRFPMEIIAGLVGITQDPETLALKPKIGWAVRDAESIDILLEQLREHHELRPPLTREELRGIHPPFDGGWSREMLKFYQKANGVNLFRRDEGFLYQIPPLQELTALKEPESPASLNEMSEVALDFSKFERVVSSRWQKVCLLPDGSCYAVTMEERRGSVLHSDEWAYSRTIPNFDWLL